MSNRQLVCLEALKQLLWKMKLGAISGSFTAIIMLLLFVLLHSPTVSGGYYDVMEENEAELERDLQDTSDSFEELRFKRDVSRKTSWVS